MSINLRILQFLALVVQNVMLILFQSSILFNISRDLFYFVLAYALILSLGSESAAGAFGSGHALAAGSQSNLASSPGSTPKVCRLYCIPLGSR